MSDSPRWCERCRRWGDHHTDRCPTAHGGVIAVNNGKVVCAICGTALRRHGDDDSWAYRCSNGHEIRVKP